MLPEIRFTSAFESQHYRLPLAADIHGFYGEVVVQGTQPFKMLLPMQKEMPLEEIIAPALAEAKSRACILDKIVFTAAQSAPKPGEGEFVAKIIKCEADV